MLSSAELVARIRVATGDTQEGLARRLGVSYPTINSWERGRSEPQQSRRRELAEFAASLGITEELKVLVIDDDPVTAELVRAAATDVDAAVVVDSALDGWEGLIKCGSMHPQVIFLDVMMPGIDGLEVARRLPQVDGLGDVQIIFVTASQSLDVLARTAEAGNAVILKPLELDALATVMSRVLRGEPIA
ncbi:CheY-like chemotaxis protein/DNA-binding XRE family transcriptional regulator [Microbacterium endophyticum]|uniref:CheY-like chemotaxis protein/DNA-binding XRE family transcriptional regulator n=1 Tax=Microbacterium endophyticum TaxID=1526412 RepID=A0A7W4YPE4_9MICO|nr:response regulator [Microbacterium endophyticum]MBB2977062.1 CheY-like chemotaxis protein/DNA-binding XRE family transcriptional regulator [Microbacterium endophyticum]NIK36144.1 CheY-like chemotaxis protein/DNA-binding XRE family transcriptional regulator [Microbacterium endophyticum]